MHNRFVVMQLMISTLILVLLAACGPEPKPGKTNEKFYVRTVINAKPYYCYTRIYFVNDKKQKPHPQHKVVAYLCNVKPPYQLVVVKGMLGSSSIKHMRHLLSMIQSKKNLSLPTGGRTWTGKIWHGERLVPKQDPEYVYAVDKALIDALNGQTKRGQKYHSVFLWQFYR